jgi:acyl-homoserine-lactone acylase
LDLRPSVAAAEQWWRMVKAENFSCFRQALELQALPMFNVVYADKNDTVFYAFNAQLPRRPFERDWRGPLPGDDPDALTHGRIPFCELPQCLNPPSGCVVSTNSSPFSAALLCDSVPDPDVHAFAWNVNNNRRIRFEERILAQDKFSFSDLKAIKYDAAYPLRTECGAWKTLAPLRALNPQKRPALAPAIIAVQNRFLSFDLESRHAALVRLAVGYVMAKTKSDYADFETGIVYKPALAARALRFAQKSLQKRFGTVCVPLRRASFIERGDERRPVSGALEVLRTLTGRWQYAQVVNTEGDTFILFVQYRNDGPIVQTVVPYGNAAQRTDQMSLFSTGRLKPRTFDKAEILRSAAERFELPPFRSER